MRPIRSVVVVIAVLALGGATMAFAGSGGPGSGGDRYGVTTIATASGAMTGGDGSRPPR